MPPVKETSDSLSHPVVEAPHIVIPERRRSVADYVALGVATCGVGFIPFAPGTWGSGVGVLLYVAAVGLTKLMLGDQLNIQYAQTLPLAQSILTTLLLGGVLLISLAGTWAATRAEKLLGKKDPGTVVVDEVAGQMLTFLFVPFGAAPLALFVGFVAFRVFDIWKPYPIRRLEGLGGGLGVMADDLLAGFYAGAVMSLMISIDLYF